MRNKSKLKRKHMKQIIILMCLCLVGCSEDRLVEITYNDYRKDTVMCNAHHFKIKDGELRAGRNTIDGGPYVIATKVKWYRILR